MFPGHAAPAELVDVAIAEGRITSVTAHRGEEVGAAELDADGAVLLPGLWDAHVHVGTNAVLGQCLQIPAEAPLEEVLSLVVAAVAASGDGLLVGFGYRSATWPVEPTAAALDAVASTPVALFAGDIHSLWCNSAGLVAAGAPLHPTGLLREDDAFAAMLHLMRTETAHVDALVREAERAAAALGVVGVCDMEMAWGVGAWQRRLESGPPLQRIEVATYPDDLDRLVALGLRTGDHLGERVRVGPLKVIVDGSLSSRTAHCLAPYPHPIPGSSHGVATHPFEEVVGLLRHATAHEVRAAVHAIGDRACRDALTAFAASGANGSIEHAQLVHPDDLQRFAELGVTASVQPAHLLEDEALLDDLWPSATDHAFALRSLLDAGVRLHFGSDAPVAPLDPWLAMDVAVRRPHRPHQALTPVEALNASTRSRVATGQVADLVLVPHTPTDLARGHFTSLRALLTLVGGQSTHIDVDLPS